jgi:hypothetical protein
VAHAYTPGLKVLKESLIKKTRLLPLKGEVVVEKDQRVSPDTIVARTELPGNVQMVNVAGNLNIEAADVDECMLKKPGDNIEQGELLAKSKGIFGLFKTSLKSPTDGTVESISGITGQVVLREAPIPVEVDAYIESKITEIISEEGVEIEAHGAFIQGIFGIGGERQGVIKVLTSDPSQELTADLITEDCRDKILVGGSFLGLAAFKKANSMEVGGIIVGGYNYQDLKPILGYDLGVAITGSEPIHTALIVTEGFGQINMAARTYELLTANEGRIASMNGATQIRAGVIRPEVIIPLTETERTGDDYAPDQITGIEEGSVVRIIRAPYFGVLGKVTGLPAELQQMESGTFCRTAEVELEDGKRVLLPRANLEMLETD